MFGMNNKKGDNNDNIDFSDTSPSWSDIDTKLWSVDNKEERIEFDLQRWIHANNTT
jgi:hypothetical protein